MSSQDQKDPMRPGEEEALEALLRHMPPKAEAPPEVRDRIRNAVEAEWRAVVARQAPPESRSNSAGLPWGRPALALAASVAVISMLMWFVAPDRIGTQPINLVTLERSVGPVELNAESAWHPVTAGTVLTVGQELVTGPQGRAQLTWHNGTTLRLDVNTRIALAANERVVVTRGAVYVDAGLRPSPDGLPQIDSRFGSTRHVGTQYEVRMAPDQMFVSVREGTVQVTGGSETVEAIAGEQLEVAATGNVQRRLVDRRDPQWAWIGTISPSFAIEQRPLTEFLVWVARETGRDLKFDSKAAETDAGQIVLRGSVAGLDPDSALAAVMATTTLSYTQDGGHITISADSTAASSTVR